MSSPRPRDDPTVARRRGDASIGRISRGAHADRGRRAVLVLLILAMTLPVPYVVLSPGPTYNTLGTSPEQEREDHRSSGADAEQDHRQPEPDHGELLDEQAHRVRRAQRLAAVRRGRRAAVLAVPAGPVDPAGRTSRTPRTSPNRRTTRSPRPVRARLPAKFGVVTVLGSGASHGKLMPGDLIDTVDGKPADTSSCCSRSCTRAAGDEGHGGRHAARREGTDDGQITLGKPAKGARGASLGIRCRRAGLPDAVHRRPRPRQSDRRPVGGHDVRARHHRQGGQVDLTHGRFIAGTGTIDADGKVGPIGGIQLKMIAARNAGATVFLAPAGNCSDVKGAIPGGLQVVKVSTLARRGAGPAGHREGPAGPALLSGRAASAVNARYDAAYVAVEPCAGPVR